MKSILVAVLSAALVVGLYVAFGRPPEGGGRTPEGWRPAPAEPLPQNSAAQAANLSTASPVRPAPVGVSASGIEAEHLKRGELGAKVKQLLQATIGEDWRRMDRLKAATASSPLPAVATTVKRGSRSSTATNPCRRMS